MSGTTFKFNDDGTFEKNPSLSEFTEPAGYAGNIAFELMRSGTATACKLHRTPDKLGGSVSLYTHPQKWEPIETAPKDGTTVIVAVPILNNKDNGYNVTAARYEDIYYVNHDYTGWVQMQDEEGVTAIWTPHFWMPLPEPPKT